MSIGASAATRVEPEASIDAPIEIDGRWDALALSELLIRCGR